MKDLLKRTTIAALAGVLAAGMFTGCGEKKVDGTKTVATVDGTDVPMGVLSLFAREQQAQTIAMYQQFMGGSASNIWSGVADEHTGDLWRERCKECPEASRDSVRNEREGCRLQCGDYRG